MRAACLEQTQHAVGHKGLGREIARSNLGYTHCSEQTQGDNQAGHNNVLHLGELVNT